MENELAALAAKQILSEEGYIDHLYQDSAPAANITIAAGHLLQTVESAMTIPFRMRATNEPALPVHIQTDWRNVKLAPYGMKAAAYKRFTALTLLETDGIALMTADIDNTVRNIRKRLSAYDLLPQPAQLALLDMGYNLGIGGLLKYRNLLRAVYMSDWRVAAAECDRHGIGAERNRRTRNLFISCLQQQVTA